jgi:hypothetical protein
VKIGSIDAVVSSPLTPLNMLWSGQTHPGNALKRSLLIRAQILGVKHPSVLANSDDRHEFKTLDELDGLAERDWRLNTNDPILEPEYSSSEEQITTRRGPRRVH